MQTTLLETHSCDENCPYFHPVNDLLGICKISGILRVKGSKCVEHLVKFSVFKCRKCGREVIRVAGRNSSPLPRNVCIRCYTKMRRGRVV